MNEPAPYYLTCCCVSCGFKHRLSDEVLRGLIAKDQTFICVNPKCGAENRVLGEPDGSPKFKGSKDDG